MQALNLIGIKIKSQVQEVMNSFFVHIFPNGTVSTLSNMTKEWSAYVFDLGVAYKEDIYPTLHPKPSR